MAWPFCSRAEIAGSKHAEAKGLVFVSFFTAFPGAHPSANRHASSTPPRLVGARVALGPHGSLSG